MSSNPFDEDYASDESDARLVASITAGDRLALEQLIKRHQAWIYNVAFRMLADDADAQDVTQEVLIKVVSRLASFRGESSFRTWLYRIVTNHIINMKKSPAETQVTTFAAYGAGLDSAPDLDIPDNRSWPETQALVDDARIGCMSAMLLCLDREQRLVFILGEILNVSDRIGAEVTDLTRGNFRQRLSRAREQLYSFMNSKCGLVKKENSCRCARKTAAFIERGYVNPQNLQFNVGHVARVTDRSRKVTAELDTTIERSYQVLYREHPYREPVDYAQIVTRLVQDEAFKRTFEV